MLETLRFSKKEKEQIRKKWTEINKHLIMNGQIPLKESEMVHLILKKSISYAKIDKNGELYLDV